MALASMRSYIYTYSLPVCSPVFTLTPLPRLLIRQERICKEGSTSRCFHSSAVLAQLDYKDDVRFPPPPLEETAHRIRQLAHFACRPPWRRI